MCGVGRVQGEMAVVHHADVETFTAKVIKHIQENILGPGDKGEGSNLGEGVVQKGDKGGKSDAVGPSGYSLRKKDKGNDTGEKSVNVEDPTAQKTADKRVGV
ncbi:hypothetical protein SESBI_24430 [Sesbania bispinosa]|nr:hypothetical protein SESBI_24430 [Sesbania bispinosa]